MKPLSKIATLGVSLLLWSGVLCGTSLSQGAPQVTPSPDNANLVYAYIPPKSAKYIAVMNRLKSFQFLEQFTQFLSPLRWPRKLFLNTRECGTINAAYVTGTEFAPLFWRIDLCYEIVEALERIGPKVGEASDISYQDAVIGALAGALIHESGHAVYHNFGVPIFGREEDAADQMAIFIALQFNTDIALSITKGLSYVSKKWFAWGSPDYSDEHGTGLQRYYNVLCLAYGGNQKAFQQIADKDLPKARAANCPAEYDQVKRAFVKTVYPFIDDKLMKKVETMSWLKLTPQQTAMLQQQQQAQQNTFALSICNQSTATGVSVALMVPSQNAWQVTGWFGVPDGGCNFIGTFAGDTAYYYAQGTNKDQKTVSWSAADNTPGVMKECIDPVNAFSHAIVPNCQAGQSIVNFRPVVVNPVLSGTTIKLGD